MFADLAGANLREADLATTTLDGANLIGASVREARFSKYATMPDGNWWTPETDMGRFTDPVHPDFWRSDDPNSPAYRGKDATGRESIGSDKSG